MLVLRKGVSGIDVNELNALYTANLRAGEVGSLQNAFDWNDTKEGYQFWSFVNSITKVVPSVDKIREQINVLPTPLLECVARELDRVEGRNKAKTLRFAFKWGETPQGEAYWHMVSDLIQYYSSQNDADVSEYNPAIKNGHMPTPKKNEQAQVSA